MEDIVAGLVVETVKGMTKVVIAKAASEKVSLGWDPIGKLEKKLEYIVAFLNDMGKAKNAEGSDLMNLWLQQLKAVAYSADNLMDDYAYEMLRRKHELSKIKEVCHSCQHYLTPYSTNPIVFRFRMTYRVNKILSELDELEKKAKDIGLRWGQIAREAVSSASTSTGYIDTVYQARKHAAARGSEFVGREQDEQTLLKMLLNPSAEEADLSIFAIFGIAGLGKTTLARRLYEHEKVGGHFDQKVWISMSKNFNIEKLLNEIVEALTLKKCELINIGAMIRKLEGLLQGKKFILVLDDVWNVDINSLKMELQKIGGLGRSVILITTRIHGVIANIARDKLHRLEGLSKEDGWTLLKQQVSDEKMNSFYDVGRRIVEKCQGVPLAIKSIGGILRLKQYESEWKSIEGSEIWNFKSDHNNYSMPSLLLSYDDINHVYAKQCFAYCAIFPKNSRMQKGQLIAMWLAQGLIQDESNISNVSVTMESIGEQYIDILVNYSFLEKESEGYQSTYKMHDLVHDLASYVSHKNLFVWKAGVKPKDVGSHLQHMAFDLEKNEIEFETHTEKKMIKKLRTISFWDRVPRWEILDCARYIRTLVMVNVGLTEVSSVIGQLVHLRYLDLSENYHITALPDSICKLYQLQTLRLLGCVHLRDVATSWNIYLQRFKRGHFVSLPECQIRYSSLLLLEERCVKHNRTEWLKVSHV